MQEDIQAVSSLNLPALALLLITGVLIWRLPRRYAICPLFTMICLMPMGQKIMLMGLDFTLFRVLLLIGMVRVIVRGEAADLRLNLTDKVFLAWIVVSVVFGSLSTPSMGLLINRSGDAYNAFGSYFFVRCVIRDVGEFFISLKTLAYLCLPVAALMLIEKITSRNFLSVFGGVPEYTFIRGGHLRCQGAFRHPILAGTFGAALIPLFVALWVCQPDSRKLAVMAGLSGLVIAITSASSGAALAVLIAVGGLAFWRFRHWLGMVLWGFVLMVGMLALVMKAPVWYLIAHLSSIVGGTGWHRAYLLDQFFGHMNEWWLFGTTYTAHWGPAGEVIAADPNMMDITNHYVMEGVKGGMLKLGLFLAIVILCFKSLTTRLRVEPDGSPMQFLFWATGVALLVHCMSFLSITYFDQTIVAWYWLLAVISGVTAVPWISEAHPQEDQPGRRGPEDSSIADAFFGSSRCSIQTS